MQIEDLPVVLSGFVLFACAAVGWIPFTRWYTLHRIIHAIGISNLRIAIGALGLVLVVVGCARLMDGLSPGAVDS